MLRKRNNYPPVVVVGTGITALSIIRSLGRRGIKVIAIDTDFGDYGAKSKYCQLKLCRNLHTKSLIEALVDIGKSLSEKAVLFCTSDISVLNVSVHTREIDKYYNFVLPSHHVIEMLMRKNLFCDFAVTNHFLVPKTHFTHNENEVKKAANEITYPCVIKPEYRDETWSSLVSSVDKVLFAESKSVYLDYFRKFNISNKDLVIQEWIEGDDHDVFFCLTYINRGSKPLAVFTGRKIRQYPVLTGSTSFAESIWIPSIADESIRLLKKSGCIGFCSVEFKRSKEDQRFYVIEPTVGRPDTQEGISVSSGMDIPYVAYLDAIGENPEPLNHFKEGIKWINEPIDFYSIQSYLKNKNSSFKKLAVSYKGKRAYALWAIDDPLPTLCFVWDKIKRGGNRLLPIFNLPKRNN